MGIVIVEFDADHLVFLCCSEAQDVETDVNFGTSICDRQWQILSFPTFNQTER